MITDFHPGLCLILCGVLTALLPQKSRKFLLIGCPALTFFLSLQLTVGDTITLHLLDRYDLFLLQITRENYIFLFVFSLLALVGGIFAAHNKSGLEAFASMGYAGGALGVTLAGGWLTLIIFWEFMAVTSLLLIWASHTKSATRAGFRYLMVHMLGGNMLLFGILIKVFHGQTQIANLTQGPHDMAFWLIFLGMAVNAAIVPLHGWVPDAYPESTVTGGVYVSSLTTKLAVLCMLRVFAGSRFLIVLGVIMILYGACFALIENNIRRLLSYHIISQLGFMIADVGLGTELAANAASALAFSNVLYKSLLFMCAGAIIYATGIKRINQLGGLAKKMPALCICFFIAALSIAGVPPLCGFTCKSLSMAAAQGAGLHLVELLMILGSIGTSLSIPFKMGYFIFFGTDRKLSTRPLPKNMYAAMGIMAGCCILFGIAPDLVYQMLPYAMDYHPYSAAHVLEYVQLVPAALIPFLIYLSKMEPHTGLTLDIGWIVRVPLRKLLWGISGFFFRIQTRAEQAGRSIYTGIKYLSDNDQARHSADRERKQIGEGMLVILIVIIAAALFVLLKHIY